jgi:hypothetical protein
MEIWIGLGFIIIISANLYLMIASFWSIYRKAGKGGWASLIPIYSNLVLLDVVGKPRWWIFLYFIPLIGLVWAIWTTNLLCKSFGRGPWFTLGLMLLPLIFLPILAFGNPVYEGPAGR